MRITATRARVALHYLAAACVAMALLVLIAAVAGARFNVTPSLPEGIYWKVDAPLQRDAYVRFCPPDVVLIAEAKKRGYIDAGYTVLSGGTLDLLAGEVFASGLTISAGGTVSGPGTLLGLPAVSGAIDGVKVGLATGSGFGPTDIAAGGTATEKSKGSKRTMRF